MPVDPRVDLDEHDRLAHRYRPDLPVVGYQDWVDLLFVHWPVPLEALRPHVPAWMTLDALGGRGYVSLVPFRVRDARLPHTGRGLSFLETNLRTYVVVDGVPGVYFFSLDAASALAVVGARTLTGLPYFLSRMHAERDDSGTVSYRLRRLPRGPACHVRYTPGARRGPSSPGTPSFFLLERYRLYVQRGPLRLCGPIHHPPLDVHEVSVHVLDDGLGASLGMPAPSSDETLAHYVPAVTVEFFPFQRVGPARRDVEARPGVRV